MQIALVFKEIQMTPFFFLRIICAHLFSFVIEESAASIEIYMYMEFLAVSSILKRHGFNLPWREQAKPHGKYVFTSHTTKLVIFGDSIH